jgi:hypothetical protein
VTLIFENGKARLYQGGIEDVGRATPEAIDMIVLCAEEIQGMLEDGSPDPFLAPFTVVRAPNDDSGVKPSKTQIRVAIAAGAAVADAFTKGKRVLVSCAQGRNRSGLVNAIALHKILGCSGREARKRIQALRPRSLQNRAFNVFIDAIPARKVP